MRYPGFRVHDVIANVSGKICIKKLHELAFHYRSFGNECSCKSDPLRIDGGFNDDSAVVKKESARQVNFLGNRPCVSGPIPMDLVLNQWVASELDKSSGRASLTEKPGVAHRDNAIFYEELRMEARPLSIAVPYRHIDVFRLEVDVVRRRIQR